MTTKTFFPVSALILLVLGFSSCKEDVKDFGGPTAEALNETFGTGFGDDVLRDVSIDKNGTIYVSSKTKIYKLDANGAATVFAGNTTAAVVDGKGTAASFRNIDLMSFDDAGNIYVIDFQFIRKISPDGTVVSLPVTKPNSLLFKNADDNENSPPDYSGLSIDGDVLYVSFQTVIVKIKGDQWNLFVGGKQLEQGFVDGKGNDGRFKFLKSILSFPSQNQLVVSDGGSLRKVTLLDSTVSTFVGSENSGTKDGSIGEALFSFINDFVIDKNGNYYLSASTVRKIADGKATTIAGPINSEGKPFQAGGIAIDLNNKYLYVTDLNQKATLIRIDLTK